MAFNICCFVPRELSNLASYPSTDCTRQLAHAAIRDPGVALMALPSLQRWGVGDASSLVPLADGHIHERQCLRHPRNGGRFLKATSARRAGYVQCE